MAVTPIAPQDTSAMIQAAKVKARGTIPPGLAAWEAKRKAMAQGAGNAPVAPPTSPDMATPSDIPPTGTPDQAVGNADPQMVAQVTQMIGQLSSDQIQQLMGIIQQMVGQ